MSSLSVFKSDCCFHLTCELSVRRPPASKLSHKLPIGLKDEDTAGFVVHSDDMSVLIHSHTLRTHESACTNLILCRRRTKKILAGKENVKYFRMLYASKKFVNAGFFFYKGKSMQNLVPKTKFP